MASAPAATRMYADVGAGIRRLLNRKELLMRVLIGGASAFVGGATRGGVCEPQWRDALTTRVRCTSAP